MKTKSGGPSRWAKRLAYAACGWALLYAAYRGYYALGGTVGMFGTPVSMSQWRLISKGIFAEMPRIIPDSAYYAITFTADQSGKIWWSEQSCWEGFADEDFRTEIRSASLVIPDKMTELWSDLGQPYVVIDDRTHLAVYLMLLGGNALVENKVAQK